jgi:hypothetical protein
MRYGRKGSGFAADGRVRFSASRGPAEQPLQPFRDRGQGSVDRGRSPGDKPDSVPDGSRTRARALAVHELTRKCSDGLGENPGGPGVIGGPDGRVEEFAEDPRRRNRECLPRRGETSWCLTVRDGLDPSIESKKLLQGLRLAVEPFASLG